MESDPNGRSARVSLLMDHRDHYSHSMYVFVLGLAIYETNAGFRKAFRDFYRLGSEDGGKDDVDPSVLEEEFATLSLEYKISNINQVKSFGRYLNAIQCFYTDRPVDFDMLTEFTPEQIAVFATMEHERWIREHQSMGWHRGDIYERTPYPGCAGGRAAENAWREALREQTRCHRLAMDGEPTKAQIFDHYHALPESEQSKDWVHFNRMLKLIRKFYGLRIYRL